MSISCFGIRNLADIVALYKGGNATGCEEVLLLLILVQYILIEAFYGTLSVQRFGANRKSTKVLLSLFCFHERLRLNRVPGEPTWIVRWNAFGNRATFNSAPDCLAGSGGSETTAWRRNAQWNGRSRGSRSLKLKIAVKP
ncbi:unnamed protein product [Ixodes pacificus]